MLHHDHQQQQLTTTAAAACPNQAMKLKYRLLFVFPSHMVVMVVVVMMTHG